MREYIVEFPAGGQKTLRASEWNLILEGPLYITILSVL